MRPRPCALALAALLASPLAAASWSVEGSTEPDTPLDLVGALMWTDPDQSPDGRDRIYFNAFAAFAYGAMRTEGGGSLLNPNLVPGSRLAPASLAFVAWLGVWRDCNRDGYVGAADGALWAYRSELLPDGLVCPEGSPYHEKGWVYEFRWITYLQREGKPYVIRGVLDPAARVWGDFGRPGEAPSAVCELTPAPRGTLRSTGGLLAHAGCQTGYALTRQMNEQDPDGSLGLRWDDPERPETDCDHALNRQTPWGDERCDGPVGAWEAGTGAPAASVWDCEARKEYAFVDVHDPTRTEGGQGMLNGTVHDPTPGAMLSGRQGAGGAQVEAFNGTTRSRTVAWLQDDTGSFAWFSQPAPRTDRLADGSWYDAARLARGNRACDGRDFPVVNGKGLLLPQYMEREPLWYTQTDSATFTERGLESRRIGGADVDGKRSHDVVLAFDDHSHTNQSHWWVGSPLFHQLDPHAGDVTNHTPYGGGATVAMYHRGGGWVSQTAYRPPTWRAALVRDDFDAASGVWTTFYASLGPAALGSFAVPGPGAAYGAEACPSGFGDRPSPAGWDCDASRWWRPDLGGAQRTPRHAAPGDPYHLRDVDCYDNRVLGAPVPVHAGPAPLSSDRDHACP